MQISANGIQLEVEDHGPVTGEPLLLIMGLGMQLVAWHNDFVASLVARGFRVIRFDNRDIGKSTWLDHEQVPNVMALFAKAAIGLHPKVPYTLADMARDSVGLLDVLGIARAHVVGASMGGMIGQVLAIEHPDRLLTFTSIMSTTGSSKLPSPKPEAAAMLTAKPVANLAEFIPFYKKMMKTLRAGDFPEDEVLDEPRARLSWERGYHPAGSARQLAAIIASGNRTKALAGIKAPTLVIHGRPDPLVPVEGGMATADAIPGAKLLIVERMGHALPLSTWGEVIGAIVDHAKT